jgi:hypothetical protein
MTLTRRDRCALALALECLRDDWGGTSRGVAASLSVSRAMDALRAACNGRDCCAYWLVVSLREVPMGNPRLLRARLALLLRVLLRVDRDDLRRWRCPEHGRRVAWYWHDGRGEEWWCAECRRWRIVKIDPPTCHIRPLWEIAAREAGR